MLTHIQHCHYPYNECAEGDQINLFTRVLHTVLGREKTKGEEVEMGRGPTYLHHVHSPGMGHLRNKIQQLQQSPQPDDLSRVILSITQEQLHLYRLMQVNCYQKYMLK